MAGLAVFVAAVWLAAYVPGRLFLAAVRVAPSRLDGLVLSLAVGLPAATAAYGLCAAAGAPGLFRLWPAAALGALGAALWARRRRGGVLVDLTRPQRSAAWPAAVAAAALLPLWASPIYFKNLVRGADGSVSYYALTDVALHVSLARELSHTVPPQLPFLPGVPASYHYGMDLLAAAFTPFGLDVQDLVVRYVPALLTAFVALAVFCGARAVLSSQAGAALVAFLVMFGEDLSFLPGLLTRSREQWAVYFFGMPTTLSLYMLNPMLPAVGLLFAALLCLQRALASDRGGWLACTAAVVAALVSCKVFVAVQLLGALGVAAAAYALVHRRLAPLGAFAAALAGVVPQLWGMWSRNAARIGIFLDPWPYVPAALMRMGLGETALAHGAKAAYDGQWSVGAAAAFAAALLAYLALTFGARCAGALAWARSLWPAPDTALRFTLAVLVGGGPVLSLVLAVGPNGYPRQLYYNDAAWFLLVSKHVAWLFAVGAVLAIGPRRARIAAAAALVALSLPSTAQLLAHRAAEPLARLSPQEAAAFDFLRREARPREVCLAQQDVAQALLVFAPCRALSLAIFPHSFLAPADQTRLRGLRDDFWRDWRGDPEHGRAARVRWDLLTELHADYVVAYRPREGDAPALAAGEGAGARALEPRFTNELFAVYRVAPAR